MFHAVQERVVRVARDGDVVAGRDTLSVGKVGAGGACTRDSFVGAEKEAEADVLCWNARRLATKTTNGCETCSETPALCAGDGGAKTSRGSPIRAVV